MATIKEDILANTRIGDKFTVRELCDRVWPEDDYTHAMTHRNSVSELLNRLADTTTLFKKIVSANTRNVTWERIA